MKHQQHGISLIGLLFMGAVLACIGIVAAQVAPTLIELQTIKKAVNKAAESNTIGDARNVFDKAAAVEDIKSLNAKDLEITQNDGVVVINFAYIREIHLAGPAYLLLKYSGRSK